MAKKYNLASLRKAYETPERTEDGPRAPNNYYPFWNMENGQKAIVRFFPDRDDDNERGFLVEQVFHNLMINGKKRKVPCLSMYGEECPVCKVSSQYYKEEGKTSVNGKKYWRKKQYIAQVVVIEDPLPPDEKTGEKHTGQLRYMSLGWQIYGVLKEALNDDDIQEVPCDPEGGYDFIIKKTPNGDYSTYTLGTKFSAKQRSLTEVELELFEDKGVELKTLLPKHPGLEKVQAMLNADLNGENYEDNRTNGSSDDEEIDDETTVRQSKPTPTVKAETPKKEESGSGKDETMSDVDAMLAEIRARRAAKQ